MFKHLFRAALQWLLLLPVRVVLVLLGVLVVPLALPFAPGYAQSHWPSLLRLLWRAAVVRKTRSGCATGIQGGAQRLGRGLHR